VAVNRASVRISDEAVRVDHGGPDPRSACPGSGGDGVVLSPLGIQSSRAAVDIPGHRAISESAWLGFSFSHSSLQRCITRLPRWYGSQINGVIRADETGYAAIRRTASFLFQ
jgi:hypothetical protein